MLMFDRVDGLGATIENVSAFYGSNKVTRECVGVLWEQQSNQRMCRRLWEQQVTRECGGVLREQHSN